MTGAGSTFFLRLAVVMVFLFLHAFSHAQLLHCGTGAHAEELRRNGVLLETEKSFENWLSGFKNDEKHSGHRSKLSGRHHRIHVVVHIVHKGEQYGIGTNLSREQVLSQIAVLNQDFNHQNPDAGMTPAEFTGVAGSMDIEFVLATRAPDGSQTDGITRIHGVKGTWTREDDVQLKAHNYWPAERYLNIWVCDLVDYRGYAQFPVSTLQGIENSSSNRLTDGVVISYTHFGSVTYANFTLEPDHMLGRTLTHEVGHFLGLRHTFGDKEDCTGSDYVADTPPQRGPTYGCPSHPVAECPESAPVNKMFQNYMDLSADACQHLFTKGQIARMRIVLENSPRRASLLVDPDVEVFEYDFEKIFTPNGDGVNDYWRWTNTMKYDGCELTVYNRFGKPVYQKTSYDNSWDGRASDGRMLESGAYWFVINCAGAPEVRGGVRIIR